MTSYFANSLGSTKSGIPNAFKLSSLIEAYSVEVAGLQESDSIHISTWARDSVAFLETRLSFHSFYGPDPLSETFGTAIISKLNLLESDYEFLPLWHEASLLRSVSWVKILFRGTEIHLVNTHLDYVDPFGESFAQVIFAFRNFQSLINLNDFCGLCRWIKSLTLLIDSTDQLF